MSWFSKPVGDGMQAFGPSNALQEVFQKFALTLAKSNLEWPAGLALFSKYDLETNVATLYISPEGSDIAKIHGFEPCEKPTIADLGMLFGSPDAWAKHFPNERPHRSRRE